MRISWVVALCALLLLCGCAGKKPAVQKPAPRSADVRNQSLIITPENSLSGKVLKVNREARFAVLNFPIGRLPSIGQLLNIYRHDLKVGEVKVTGPQKEDNIVADIIVGETEVGDLVRDR